MPPQLLSPEEQSAEQSENDPFFYWRLCDELTVVQASLLMIGLRPDYDGLAEYVMGYEPQRRPENFDAALRVISAGLQSGKIHGTLVRETRLVDVGEHEYADMPIEGSLNPSLSTVNALSVRAYLHEKGLRHGFFGPTLFEKYSPPNYLSPIHPCYAPKLAAAVEAWLAVTDEGTTGAGGTPKQAIEKWLRLNAARLGLTNKDGGPNKLAIDEISKIANWNIKGGAAKTPSKPKTATGGGRFSHNPPTPVSGAKNPVLKAVAKEG